MLSPEKIGKGWNLERKVDCTWRNSSSVLSLPTTFVSLLTSTSLLSFSAPKLSAEVTAPPLTHLWVYWFPLSLWRLLQLHKKLPSMEQLKITILFCSLFCRSEIQKGLGWAALVWGLPLKDTLLAGMQSSEGPTGWPSVVHSCGCRFLLLTVGCSTWPLLCGR